MRKVGYNVVMSERERKSSFGDLSLRYDRERAPSLPDGKTGIHSVDAANEVYQKISEAERKAKEADARAEQAREESYVDALTGCLNRNFFEREYKKNIFNPVRDDGKIGLIFIDLNDLKTTNDTVSYDAGDQMLKDTAELLRRCARSGDLVVRMGGDEFVAICRNDNNDENFAENVSNLIEQRFYENSQISLAFGSAVYDRTLDEARIDETKDRASRAMKEHKVIVKSNGNGNGNSNGRSSTLKTI